MSDDLTTETVRFCSKDFDEDSGSCTFSFGEGTNLALELDSLSPEIQRQLMIHGALQKIGDSYAGAKGDYTVGIAAAQAVIDLLKSGNWRASREGSGTSGPRIGELANAVARVKGIELGEAAAKVAALDDEQRKALRANIRIKKAIADIRSEKASAALAKASADSDAALAALG